jgi:hypothetical protein
LRYEFEKPVKVGEEYEVEIEEIATGGDGVARIKDWSSPSLEQRRGRRCAIAERT